MPAWKQSLKTLTTNYFYFNFVKNQIIYKFLSVALQTALKEHDDFKCERAIPVVYSVMVMLVYF